MKRARRDWKAGSSRCGRGPFGCCNLKRSADMHHPSGLCKDCALALSRRMRVTLGDLSRAMAAYDLARSRKGDRPTMEETWVVIEEMNRALPEYQRMRRQDKYIPVPPPNPHAPADACLPEGDRVAA